MSWAKLRMLRGMAERRALRRLERRAVKPDTTEVVAPEPITARASISMDQIHEAVAAGNMIAKAAKASAVQPPQGRTAARSDAAESRVSEDIAPAEAGAEAKMSVVAQEGQTADDASGCKGRAAEVTNGPAPVDGLVADPPMVAVKARQSRNPIPLLEFRDELKRREARALRDAKIDISAAPSGMEAAAERWKGKGPAPMELAPVPELCAGEVLCRCGSRASGKGRGPVPVWFGEKCIEANCELRGKA